MRLKYHEDIKWNDLERVEKPFFAGSTVRRELNKPLSTLTGGFASEKNPLDQIRRPGRRGIDNDLSRQFYRDIQDGKILLVHDFDLSEHHQAFKFVKDDSHPDKGKWTLAADVSFNAEYQLKEILRTVKKPPPRGSIKSQTTTAPDYGNTPSTSEIAEKAVKGLYNIGKRTPAGLTVGALAPSTIGGTSTYEVDNEPDLRIIESDVQPARYQRRVDGEWETTGVQAIHAIEGEGFEALSPEDVELLKSTGGIPIHPELRSHIEIYPPDDPPDSSPPAFPAEDREPMANPGYGDTDAADVAGSPIMFNQSGDGDLNSGRNSDTITPNKTDRLKKHVLNGELDAARREASGEVVARKADGTPWDHVTELRDAQRGLLKRIKSINKQLGRNNLDDATRSSLEKELGEASSLLDKTEDFLPRQ